jgi:hypothetical protein
VLRYIALVTNTQSEGVAMTAITAGGPDLSDPSLGSVNVTWYKSRHSIGNGNCIEAARLSGHMAVRDSKDASGPVLLFPDRAWNAFIGGIRAGAIPTL